jgi:hypothetical protein
MELRLRKASELKYFLYISEAKVNMLYGQIASGAEANKVQWKADFKLASYSYESQINDGNRSKEDRLKAVIDSLEKADLIGTVDEPKEYFRGSIPMRWGLFEDQGRPANEGPLVYFGGYGQKTILGLGGSSKHLLGMDGSGNTGSRSCTPYLVSYVLAGMNIDQTGWNAFQQIDHEHSVFEGIIIATSQLKGPTQTMEFVAKTLLEGTTRHSIVTRNERKQCLLGTPLYVSLPSPKAEDPWKAPWIESEKS